MQTKTQIAAGLGSAAALTVGLSATPSAADWHYYEGTRAKGTQYERLYVREQGKNRKRVTAYLLKRYTDAGPICYRGKQDSNPDYYRVYHGTWTARTFPDNAIVTKPTTFYYNRLTTGRKWWGTWESKVRPDNGGWLREQIWPGLPRGARSCFR